MIKVLLRRGYGGHHPAPGTSKLRFRAQDGGAEGVRTPDLLNAIQALYQLSYDPIRRARNLKSQPRLSNFLPAVGR